MNYGAEGIYLTTEIMGDLCDRFERLEKIVEELKAQNNMSASVNQTGIRNG